jgi:uncharacterized coiled-coil protein SlyX
MSATAAQKKAERMKAKSERVRSDFELPSSEVVIQDYTCSLHLPGRIPALGTLWITQNYLAFSGLLEKKVRELLPFRRVSNVVTERYFGLPNAICVDYDAASHKWFLSGLHNRTETFALVDHLHRFPVSYTRVVKKPRRGANISTEHERAQLLAGATSKAPAAAASAAASSSSSSSSGAAPAAGADLKARAALLEQVDVKTSAEAVALVHQIRELAADTLAELNDQATTIDEMAGDLERVEAATKKGEQHAKAVDSVMAAMASDNSDLKTEIDRHMGQRTKIDIKERPEATVPVLWKHKSDLLSQAELVLNRDTFVFVDLREGVKPPRKQLRKPEPYSNVTCLIARARPYHVDVRLSKGTRIRFMSARIQTAITEIAMRAELPSAAIVFEPLVRRFGVDGIVNDVEDVVIEESESDDGDEQAQRLPDDDDAAPDAPAASASASAAAPATDLSFVRPSQQRVGAVADVKAAADIAKQDREVDEISSVLVELRHVADHMGKELERQTQQLEKMNAEADATNARLARTAQTIDDLVEN